MLLMEELGIWNIRLGTQHTNGDGKESRKNMPGRQPTDKCDKEFRNKRLGGQLAFQVETPPQRWSSLLNPRTR